MGLLSFAAKWFGRDKLKSAFKATAAGVDAAVGKRNIEELLLKETRDRFEPAGANPLAQMSPDGVPWKPVTKETIRRRKSNRNATQALFDTGTLQSALMILRSNTNSATARHSGATAQIGVNPSSPAYEYYALHQEGGLNSQGIYIEARPFLGVSKATEARVERTVISTIKSFIKRFF